MPFDAFANFPDGVFLNWLVNRQNAINIETLVEIFQRIYSYKIYLYFFVLHIVCLSNAEDYFWEFLWLFVRFRRKKIIFCNSDQYPIYDASEKDLLHPTEALFQHS